MYQSIKHLQRCTDPDSFLPQQWLATQPACYGFGVGSGQCPGQEWALIQIKICLITFIKRFNIQRSSQVGSLLVSTKR